MKNEIIEMMAFPRDLIRGNVPFETCGHAGHYARRDPECRVCESRLECEWLYHNDEFAALEQKSLESLLEALQSALLYVDACVYRAGHDPKHCSCNACTWLTRAQAVYDTAAGSG